MNRKISPPGLLRRASARKGPLTPSLIVEAALRKIDAEGLEALSMRRLGAALGVEAMALYHHFPSKGRLLDAVMERLLAEAELPQQGSLPPLDRLRRFLESYRQVAIRHPHAFILLVNRRFNTEPTFEFYEQILEALEDADFDPPLAARFFRLMGYYVSGAGMAEIASRAQQPDATPVRLENFAESERFPRVAAVVPHLRMAKLDAIFAFGLDVIFEAMRAKAGGGKETARKKPARRGGARP